MKDALLGLRVASRRVSIKAPPVHETVDAQVVESTKQTGVPKSSSKRKRRHRGQGWDGYFNWQHK